MRCYAQQFYTHNVHQSEYLLINCILRESKKTIEESQEMKITKNNALKMNDYGILNVETVRYDVVEVIDNGRRDKRTPEEGRTGS